MLTICVLVKGDAPEDSSSYIDAICAHASGHGATATVLNGQHSKEIARISIDPPEGQAQQIVRQCPTIDWAHLLVHWR